jgi:cystathionine beta-lyase family protein involved in aluminum resistance
VTGAPYETLLPVLGGLRELGVTYRETSCLLDYQEGKVDLAGLERGLAQAVTAKTRVVFIQRSRGYTARKGLSIETLEAFMRLTARNWPGILTVVDNCYCEFVQDREPPSVGASVTAGSLIKNPGGGLCPAGGYVAGTADCVRRVAEALYAPGLAGEVGSNPYGYRDMYQGFFIAPKTVGEALKGAYFASAFFQELGFEVDPGPLDPRCDIVQAVTMGSPEKLKTLARSIQAASPVDSFAVPEPWNMPGYRHQVIMAAGTFVQGSSIELSCDAPFIPPYTAYLQGGLTKEHVMLACMRAGDALI